MAVIVDTLASQFRETVVAIIKDEIILVLGAEDELRQLKEKIQLIHALLEDAQRRGVSNLAVRSWLATLKDFIYDADDTIDYSCAKAEKLARLSTDKPVRCYSPLLSVFPKLIFRHQVGTRVRGINLRLDEIMKVGNGFGLVPAAVNSQGSSRALRHPGPDVDPDIVGAGIEEDTNKMVRLLTVEGKPEVSVYAIVGMGGIGKTTLAQKIYNHKVIKDNFQMPPPIWVCVSKDYSETKLLQEILKNTGLSPGNTESPGELQRLLGETINRKKFFLILDDVWTADVWELLKTPLRRGAAGSRILITTRDERVPRHMKAASIHYVQPLSLDDGWFLLCKMVFYSEDEENIHLLEDVGKQIVMKCCGLPLAIKTIAGVLRDKECRRWEWERVLQNPAWSMTGLTEGVMGALYLSYEDLPSHLKQCFIFCSLFPEDHVFMRHTLIQLWVAEGFVKEERGAILEEVARDYYRELIRRSLLQRDPRYYDEGGCKMHDLLRSLAQFLARDEYYVGDVKGLIEVSSSLVKVRHLSVIELFNEKFPEVIKEQKFLRTLLCNIFMLLDEIPGDLFEKLSCLRVLDLRSVGIDNLPESVGSLVHLRYLDLSGGFMEELPNSIGNLSNLQYLILQKCENLEELPASITKLYKLRSLDLHKTPLNGIPRGLGKLRHVNRLIGFRTNETSDGGKEWCSLKELESLSDLRTLTIVHLERSSIGAHTRGSFLKDKVHLRHLELACSSGSAPVTQERMMSIEEVFDDELFPPPSLEKFEIKGFFGNRFPNWMMTITPGRSSLFANLKRLDLLKCTECRQLPPLGRLPQLDLLTIESAYSVKSIGPEFMGGEQIAFPKLKTLRLRDMPNLAEWIWGPNAEAKAMPCLESLELSGCPMLRSLPEGLGRDATALTTLFIQFAHSLDVVEGLASLRGLLLIGCNSLRRVANFSSVQMMKVDGCPALLKDVYNFPLLQFLEWGDSKMESLPEWLLPREVPAFPAIERLNAIVGEVRTLCRCAVDGPDWPKIRDIPHVYIQVMNSHEFIFYNRDPFTFNTNLNDAAATTVVDDDKEDKGYDDGDEDAW